MRNYTRGILLRLPTLSLRLRLTLWLVMVALFVQVALGLGVLLYQRGSIGRLSDARIQARAEFIAVALRGAGFNVTDADLGRMAEDSLKYSLLDTSVVTLYTGSGEPVASNLRPAPSPEQLQLMQAQAGSVAVTVAPFVPGPDVASNGRFKARMVLQRVTSEDGREFVLLLAATDTYYEAMILVTIRAMLLLIPICTLASAIAAWLIAGRAIAPLNHFRLIADSFAPSAIENELELPLPSSPEVRAIERGLRIARSHLRTALHSQDRFISSVSHELNTPIAVLLTEAQTLSRQDLTPGAENFVRSVTDEMRHLGRIVESFLTLTRLRCRQPVLRFRACGVNDFVMDAVENCAKFATQSGVTLAPQLALGDRPLIVSGEAELLSVMLDNLVRNAVRFSTHHQQVVVRVEQRGAKCELTVRDFGKGVADGLMGKLSQRFAQSSNQLIVGRGHGRGLSIAQSIAELHGGSIAVRNMHQGGCEFSIILPLATTNGAVHSLASV